MIGQTTKTQPALKTTQYNQRKSNKRTHQSKQNISQQGINMIGEMKKDMQLLKSQLRRYSDFRNSSVDEIQLNNSNIKFEENVQESYISNYNTPSRTSKKRLNKSNIFISKIKTQESPFKNIARCDPEEDDGESLNLDEELFIEKRCQINATVPRRSYYQDNMPIKTKKTVVSIQCDNEIFKPEQSRSSINEMNLDRLLQKNKTLKSEITLLKKQQKNAKDNLKQTTQNFNKEKMRLQQELRKQRNSKNKIEAELQRSQTISKQLSKKVEQLKKENQILNKNIYELNFEKSHLKNLIKILENHIKNLQYPNSFAQQNLKLKKQLEIKTNQISSLKILNTLRNTSQEHLYEIENYKTKLINIQQQKDEYQNIIKGLDSTIKKILIENTEKDQFMKSYLINKVNGQPNLTNKINQFFEDYRVNMPQYNLSKYIFEEIHKKLGQIILY